MPKLTDIDADFDLTALMKKTRIKPGSPDAEEFTDLVEQARKLASPKALFREVYIEGRGSETVTIDGVTFTSAALRKNLEEAERAFVFVATCGREMDRIEVDPSNFLGRFWLDSIKEAALGAAIAHLNGHLDEKFGLGKTSAMSPGSGDVNVWPIEQQKKLFSLLGDVEGQIGVELTDSCLMIPRKSISGIRFPTEIDFRTCQLCHREDCPSRSAAFDPELWDAVHGD
jgi:hypothetical protein